MKYYVDVVSGLGPLHELSNKRFTELKEIARIRKVDVLTLSKNDDMMNGIHHFENCYWDGAVSSVCTRRVIEATTLMDNIRKAFATWKTPLHDYASMNILNAALTGVSQSCSANDQSHYQPE